MSYDGPPTLRHDAYNLGDTMTLVWPPRGGFGPNANATRNGDYRIVVNYNGSEFQMFLNARQKLDAESISLKKGQTFTFDGNGQLIRAGGAPAQAQAAPQQAGTPFDNQQVGHDADGRSEMIAYAHCYMHYLDHANAMGLPEPQAFAATMAIKADRAGYLDVRLDDADIQGA